MEKHTDKYLTSMAHIKVTNRTNGKFAITTCDRKRTGTAVSKLKKILSCGC